MKSTCVLLIPLFLLVAQVSCSIRFSYLGSHYDGTFVEEVGVSSTGECTLLAFNKKKIGYRVKVNEGKKTCALLTTFNRFTTLNDSNIRDYILTISISDQVCTVNTTKKATEFISGQCKPDEWDCELLKKMRDYCIFVGSDKPDCISSTGVSMEKVECPKGQHRVAVKKETLLCCPEGETLAEERNGKALLPREETLEASAVVPAEKNSANAKEGSTTVARKERNFKKFKAAKQSAALETKFSKDTFNNVRYVAG
ncbi:hypothetical protein QR680_004205 [Steinernema hermaphroditum]|uniref:Secreted protein n=1 Tax=Steinernema hermaphroditum TaxID=289476 RepID=A0AA39LST9_9BILA|nr:hypothetical protein QR680_004205 [Steinernema hermaphroditum]